MKINEVKRRKILNELIPIERTGKEWFIFLVKETRNSLAAENIFCSGEDVEALISNEFTASTNKTALNYFYTARFLYELAHKYLMEDEKPPYKILLVTIHSLLLSGNENFKKNKKGFRTGPMRTEDSKISPLPEPTGWIDFWTGYIEYVLHNYSVFSAVARIHSLFVHIRPFYANNELIGRLMINFILITRGYHNISIEASIPGKKTEYSIALKKSGRGIRELFDDFLPGVDIEEGAGVINGGDFSGLEEIFYESMIESLNYFLVVGVQEEELLTVKEVSDMFKISETAVKKRILSGSMVASKLGGNTWKIPKKYIVFRRSLRNRNPIW